MRSDWLATPLVPVTAPPRLVQGWLRLPVYCAWYGAPGMAFQVKENVCPLTVGDVMVGGTTPKRNTTPSPKFRPATERSLLPPCEVVPYNPPSFPCQRVAWGALP